MSAAQVLGELSPYLAIERADWAELGKNTQLPLTEKELTNLKSLGDFLDMKEVEEVYLPVSHLLSLHANQTQKLHSAASDFMGERSAVSLLTQQKKMSTKKKFLFLFFLLTG